MGENDWPRPEPGCLAGACVERWALKVQARAQPPSPRGARASPGPVRASRGTGPFLGHLWEPTGRSGGRPGWGLRAPLFLSLEPLPPACPQVVLRVKLSVAFIFLVPGTTPLLYYQTWGKKGFKREKEKSINLNTLILFKQLTKHLSAFCRPWALISSWWGLGKFETWPCVYTELCLQPLIVFQGVAPIWKEITSPMNPSSRLLWKTVKQE